MINFRLRNFWYIIHVILVLELIFYKVDGKEKNKKKNTDTTSTTTTSDDRDITNNKVFRHDHLDYFDVETIQYYLKSTSTSTTTSTATSTTTTTTKDTILSFDYDVAIMFYVQWSSHCHTLAPMWDQISRILNAGTIESKIIFGLFDCEDTKQHELICQSIGITKYPTLAFLSMAGMNHPLSFKEPRHMTIYKGNWQYGDAILDWIRTLSTLSQWHRSNWIQKIRNIIFKQHTKKTSVRQQQQQQSLPIGIPQSMIDAQELQSLRKEMNKTVSLAKRASSLLEVLFVPIQYNDTMTYPILNEYTGGTKNYTDVYGMLHERNAWKTDTTTTTIMTTSTIYNVIVRTCTCELTMDYCDRLSNHFMNQWIDLWPLDQKLTDEAFILFQKQLNNYMNHTESHCIYMDECSISNFTKSFCQPITCPFHDRMACRYLTACLTDRIYNEYDNALGLVPTDVHQKSNHPNEKNTKKGGFSWGL
jgi:Thioredoxin